MPDIVDFLKRLPANTTVFCRERAVQMMSEIVPARVEFGRTMTWHSKRTSLRWQREGNGALVAFRDDVRASCRKSSRKL